MSQNLVSICRVNQTPPTDKENVRQKDNLSTTMEKVVSKAVRRQRDTFHGEPEYHTAHSRRVEDIPVEDRGWEEIVK